MGRLGADTRELRELASVFDRAGEALEDDARAVSARVAATGWQGADARRLIGEWNLAHRPSLVTVARRLANVAGTLREQANEQDRVSEARDGAALTGTATGVGAGDRPGDVFDVAATGKALIGVGLAGVKASRYGFNLRNYMVASAAEGDAAASAAVFNKGFMWSDAVGRGVAKGSAVGRWAGPVGGALAVVSGVNQMFNPRYDGWRGGVDRVMGGVGAVGGVATIGMVMGVAACTGPVGIGIAVGAGLVVGAWELGNLVVDNWDTIRAFLHDPLPYLHDGVATVQDAVNGAVTAAGDAAKGAASSVSDALADVGDFAGGLFA